MDDVPCRSVCRSVSGDAGCYQCGM